jgi:hypothetical protein
MVRVPFRLPETVGRKVAVIVQLVPAASCKLQSSVSPKLALVVIDVMWRTALPEFVTVTERVWLVSPISSLPKPRVAADKVTVGGLFIDGELPPQPEHSISPEKATARKVFTNTPAGTLRPSRV